MICGGARRGRRAGRAAAGQATPTCAAGRREAAHSRRAACLALQALRLRRRLLLCAALCLSRETQHTGRDSTCAPRPRLLPSPAGRTHERVVLLHALARVEAVEEGDRGGPGGDPPACAPAPGRAGRLSRGPRGRAAGRPRRASGRRASGAALPRCAAQAPAPPGRTHILYSNDTAFMWVLAERMRRYSMLSGTPSRREGLLATSSALSSGNLSRRLMAPGGGCCRSGAAPCQGAAAHSAERLCRGPAHSPQVPVGRRRRRRQRRRRGASGARSAQHRRPRHAAAATGLWRPGQRPQGRSPAAGGAARPLRALGAAARAPEAPATLCESSERRRAGAGGPRRGVRSAATAARPVNTRGTHG